MNPETLFQIAEEFLNLDDRQKLHIGMRMGLVSIGAAMYSPDYLSEQVFSKAYKTNVMARFVKEIEKAKNGVK